MNVKKTLEELEPGEACPLGNVPEKFRECRVICMPEKVSFPVFKDGYPPTPSAMAMAKRQFEQRLLTNKFTGEKLMAFVRTI